MSLEELNAELERINKLRQELNDRQYELSQELNKLTDSTIRQYIESGQFLREYPVLFEEIWENDIEFIVTTDKQLIYRYYQVLGKYECHTSGKHIKINLRPERVSDFLEDFDGLTFKLSPQAKLYQDVLKLLQVDDSFN